ncbi:uncharacterized protein LOC143424575 [Xylocopa sonorina]|uniref:uncharacterized protein LOC143424575 n=1 Tax=Xylocopa sonorina TaxID=1818115 RepID=UPI00403B30D9
MYFLVVILLLAICNPSSTSFEICDKENNGLQSEFRNGKFLQNIRDWFYNLKNQIHDRLFGEPVVTPLFLPDVLNLDKFELQNRLRNRGWQLLDLFSLSIDPNEDWGFRIGNWYFIRKESNDQDEFENNSDESDFQIPSTIQSNDSNDIETTEAFDITKETEVETESSSTISTTISEYTMNSVISLTTQQNDLQTVQTTELIDSSENFTSKTDEPNLTRNETYNDFVRTASAEVIMG